MELKSDENKIIKKKVLSLREKIDIIHCLEKKKLTARQVACLYKIGKTQAAVIIKYKEQIKSQWLSGANLNMKRNFNSSYGAIIDKLCWEYFVNSISENILISRSLMKTKALEFAKELNLTNFHASDGWLYKWQRRHNVNFKQLFAGKKRSLPSLEPNKKFEPSIMEPLITIKAEPEVRNEPISDAISYIKKEKSEYMTEFQTVYPDYLDVQNEMLNDPITIVKEEPSEYISEFETSAPDHLSMQFEIINDPISIVKEEPSEMIINEYFSPSTNDRTMPREDVQSKADNIVPTKIICDDDHMLFLRSLMPFFKKLDTTQTLRLRNKFKELLIQEINSNNLQNG